MTGMDVARLREVAEKATPGPWHATPWDLHPTQRHVTWAVATPDDVLVADAAPEVRKDNLRHPENAEFIAACDPPTVLALLDVLADQDARLAAVEALGDPEAMGRAMWKASGTNEDLILLARAAAAGAVRAALNPGPNEGGAPSLSPEARERLRTARPSATFRAEHRDLEPFDAQGGGER